MTVVSQTEERVNPSLFEGINARYYRASEVARSFVPSEQFENAAINQHTLLVGPRGSGKTTLLRMLHSECLRSWNHPSASHYRNGVTFSSAYIATDRVWRQQADSAAQRLPADQREEFIADIVAIDVMAAMLRTIENRFTRTADVAGDFRYVEIGGKDVARLVAELAEAWHLAPKFLDLGSLRLAVRRRRSEARHWIAQTIDGKSRAQLGRISWEDAALVAIDSFEAATGLQDERWALLFDELEIVPGPVRDSILGATRGIDPRLLLKCSLSPWLQEHILASEDHDATALNDFNVVRLFFGRRAESYQFSRQLLAARVAATGLVPQADVSIEDAVFGPSQFIAEDAEGKRRRTASAYGDAAPLGQVVKELANHDPNFREWLKSKRINPLKLGNVPEKERSETLRKARNVMIARLEFRRAAGHLRSRKSMAMYTGGATMLDICEGNPRLLLGLLRPLLEFYDGKHPIPRPLQAEALAEIARDFYALIDAIPVTESMRAIPELGKHALRSPYREFIDRIAKSFRAMTLRGEFNPQPPSTFRVPRNTSQSLQVVIGRLINMGAVIIVPDRGVRDVLVGAFDQQRLRLCYLIAASEHLPPNVDRPVSVIRLLADDVAAEVPSLPGFEEGT